MGLHHIQVTQRGKTGFVARSKATNAIQVIKCEDWDYRRDYCDKHFDHTFGVEEGSKLILAAEEQFKGYTEFKLELVPASLPAIPYPELQASHAAHVNAVVHPVRRAKPTLSIEARKASIEKQMDAITEQVRERMKNVGPDMLGLLPTESDWMTPEEREQMHALRLQLPSHGEEAAAARERIKLKRAARLAQR